MRTRPILAGILALLLMVMAVGCTLSNNDSTQPSTNTNETENRKKSINVTAADLTGAWSCQASDGGMEYVFGLTFAEPDKVTYWAGVYQSETFADYEGKYTLSEDGLLTLTMTGEDPWEPEHEIPPINAVFAVTLTDDVLTLVKQSGNFTAIFGDGEPMAFDRESTAKELDPAELAGKWLCYTSDEDTDFVFGLEFTEPDNRVSYWVGVVDSEVDASYDGQFSITEEGWLALEMTGGDPRGGVEAHDTINATFGAYIEEDVLTLVKQRGDSLSYLFEEAGIEMAFVREGAAQG